MNNGLFVIAYKRMLRIRMIEERLVQEYLEKNIRSFVHFYIGQEAVATGVCMNLMKSDYVFSTHRSHGHYLAKGGDLNRMIAELYGKIDGCSKGRGGSMHLIDKSVGFMGSISILASVVPIAVGAAYSLKKKGEGNICVVFVGDGASDEGGFYESLNLAALMKVPILFVVENNLYAGMSDRDARHSKGFELGTIAEGFGLNFNRVNGNDFGTVYYCTKELIEDIKNKEVPAVLECMTFRHMAHSAPIFDDKLGYRKLDDLETRQKCCPVKRLKELIISNKWTDEKTLNSFKEEINYEIDEAFKFAEKSSFPKSKDLMDGVYYEG